MKKISILFITCLGLISNIGKAQNASETNIEIMKVSQPCVMATYNFSQDLLDETIKGKFAEAKASSPDKSKGFKIYKGVIFPEFGADKFDVYIKTDGKKETSIAYVAVSKGYDNFVKKETDTAIVNNVTRWMNNLTTGANLVQLNHDIEDAQEVQKKSDKKYVASVEDGKDLQKDMEKLLKKIEDNKALQAVLLKELNDQSSKLNTLKEKLTK
jgi:tRNA pseudouridine-54 N-methylase